MKTKSKTLLTMLCIAVFAFMALGSGSSSGETKEVVPTDGQTAESTSNAPETSGSVSGVSIDEQILVDQNGVKITATQYTTDSIWGDGISLLIENNSDKDYTVGCDALIVNDYMITDLFASEIAAGKKANETMYLSSAGLNAAGIESVGKVEIYFHAYDSKFNNVFQNVYSEIRTSNYDSMDTTPDDSGMELYNKDGIKIVGRAVDENSFWGTAVLLYCENSSGKNVGISVDDMSINGFMMNPFFSTTVYDGKKCISDITIFSSDLEENGIKSIDEAELKFHIYNADTFDTIADSDPITFSAQ